MEALPCRLNEALLDRDHSQRFVDIARVQIGRRLQGSCREPGSDQQRSKKHSDLPVEQRIFFARSAYNGLLTKGTRSSMYFTVVAQVAGKGQRLVQEEIDLTQIEVLEGGALTVSGSIWTGYALSDS
jgi:hypothetical protein